MVKAKKPSKRQTCKKKFKIVKKILCHNKKLRREAKKNPSKFKRKDPGVPNSLPFKDEILKEIETRKQIAKDLKQAQKDSRLKQQNENRGLSDLVDDATKKEMDFEEYFNSVTQADQADQLQAVPSKSFKSYYTELKKVVEAADVLLEVLDARDPLGSRCPQLEEMVISSGKRLVLVLNKIDLIPKENLEAWLAYLRRELPTVAFKSSTQAQNSNLSQSKVAAIHMAKSLQSSRACVGASFLMKVLGNYSRSQDIQTFIKVGVVGFPNVGKSSVINSLKRSRSCSVGATPGITKSVQEVSLDKHIKILDSPGVVFAKDGSATTLALRNAVKVEKLDDVITPAEAIIQRTDHTQLCLHYCIPEFRSTHDLLCLLAKRIGAFRKGGVPNERKGARKLIDDWNSGKIKYYTHPPEEYKRSVHISAEYVEEIGKAFKISSFEEKRELDRATELFPSECVAAKPVGLTEGIVDVDNDDEMEEDEEKETQLQKVVVTLNVKKMVRDFNEKQKPYSASYTLDDAVRKQMDNRIKMIRQEGNEMNRNKVLKMIIKAKKKKLRRKQRAEAAMSTSIECDASPDQ